MNLASLDMYRRVPADLMEGPSFRGSVFSVCALLAMVVLFVAETRAFLEVTLVKELRIDDNKEKRLRVNFNISLYDLACEYAEVDVVSFQGTEQEVRKNVNKWSIDQDKIRQRFAGRNKIQKDILYHDATVTESLEELHANGVDAVDLDENTLEEAKRMNEFLFVDFFASWCSHCQKLAPTWETLAEVMHGVALEDIRKEVEEHFSAEQMADFSLTEEEIREAARLQKPVEIAKIDCEQHKGLCMRNSIFAYPTLRLYVNGKFHSNYRGDRTVHDFTNYLGQVETQLGYKNDGEESKIESADTAAVIRSARKGGKPLPSSDQRRAKRDQWKDEEHPGCQLSGFLMIDRAPGNFHIKAKSNAHDLAPAMTNVSHEVHDLSFGEPAHANIIRKKDTTAPKDVLSKIFPMNDYVYVTPELHTSYQHHLKIVTTEYSYVNWGMKNIKGPTTGITYQVLAQSQLSHYEENVVPEARFVYDLSPVMIVYKNSWRAWYDYVTSIMAILGGTFTVVGMFEASVHNVSRKKGRRA